MSVNIGVLEGLIRFKDESATATLNKVERNVQSFAARTSNILNKSISFSLPSLGQIAAFAAIGAAVKSVYDNVAEAQKAFAQLEAGVRSTGGAAGYSAEQLAEMAGELQRLTGAEDEALMGAQSVLLTFTNIRDEIFQRTLPAVADLSARLGTDLNSAAMQVGKALNNPIKGIAALNRAGIQFTADQKETIKSLVETNRVAEAQVIILEELERQVGGSAEAFRNTLPGAIAALQGSWGNLLEEIGKSGESGGFFRTGIEGMVTALDYLADHWHELESAVFTTLGEISSALTKAIDVWLEGVGRFARGLQIINPGMWLGEGKKGIEEVISTIDSIRKTVRQTGEDFKVGFEQKAADAIEAAIAPTKGLGKEFKGLGALTGEVSDATKQLAKEYDALIKKLNNSIKLNKDIAAAYRKGANKDQIQQIKDAAKAHEEYLSNVEKFGKAGAKAIADLTAADLASARAADKAKDAWEARADSMKEFVKQTERLIDLYVDAGLAVLTDSIRVDLEDAASLTSSMATEAERWAAEEARALELLNAGLITQETYDRLLKSHTQQLQLQESSYERQRRIVSEIAGEIGNWAGVLNQVFGGVNEQVGQVLSGVQTFTSALQAYNAEGATWSQRAMAGAQMGQGIFQAGQGLGLWQGNRGQSSFGGQMSGDYADVGAMIGGIFGPVWGLVGAVLGSLIKKGADEGLGRIFMDLSGEITSGANFGNLHEATSSIAHNIEASLEEIMNAIGGELIGFSDILIKIRDEIITVTVGDIQRRFKDTEAAIAFAISEALRQAEIAGLSPEMQSALEHTAAQTVDEFLRDIQTAQWAERLGMSDMAIQIDDVTKVFLANFNKLVELGIDTAEAIEDYHNQLSGLKDELLGFNRSTANYLRNLAGFNAGIDKASEDMRRRLEGNISEWQTRIDNLINQGRGTLQVPKPGGQPGELITVRQTEEEWQAAIEELRRQQQEYINQLNELPQRMSEAEIDMGIFQALFQYLGNSRKYAEQAHKYALMRVEIEFESIRLQLIAMDRWEQFAGMFNDALAAARRQAGESIRPGRGGGGSGRADAREWLVDRQAEVAARGLSEYARQQAELIRLYDEQISQAGRDIALRTQLITLRDQELEQLRQQQVGDIVRRFQENMGLVNQFDQVRNSAADFIKEINSSPLGDVRKANMIARVLESVERTITRMSMESARGLLGEMIADLEKFGASEELLHEAQRHMAIIEHTLKMEHYKTEIEILKAQGKLAPEVLAALERSFDFLKTVDPTVLIDPSDPYSPVIIVPKDWWLTEETSEFAQALKRARDLLAKYQSDGLMPIARTLRQINTDFEEIYKGIGRNAETITAHAEAVSRAIEQWLEPIRNLREELRFGEMSPLDTQTQWGLALQEFLAAQSAFDSGDIGVVDQLPDIVQRFMGLLREMTPIGSEAYSNWAEIVDSLLARVENVTGEDILADPLAAGMSDLSEIGSSQLLVMESLDRTSSRMERSLTSIDEKIGNVAQGLDINLYASSRLTM